MRLFKLLISFSLLVFAAGVVGARITNSLFPVFPISVLILSLIILLTVFYIYNGHVTVFYSLLLTICFFSLAIRIFIFTFPASMIAFDPDTFAISIQKVVQAGNTSGIASGFYSEVPLFHIFTATYAQIASVRAAGAMGIWPVLVGIMFPIVTVILSLYLSLNTEASLIGGIIMAVLSNSVTFSYTPIPHLAATILFVTITICIYKIYNGNRIYLVPSNILFIALIYTHKLHPLVIVLGIAMVPLLIVSKRAIGSRTALFYFDYRIELIAITVVASIAWSVVVSEAVPGLLLVAAILISASALQIVFLGDEKFKTPNIFTSEIGQNGRFPSVDLLLTFGSLLAIQWVIITNLLYSVVVRSALPLIRQRETIQSAGYYDPAYARTASTGILDIFYHQSDVLIILLAVGIAWIFYYYLPRVPAIVVLLAMAGVALALVPTALFAGVSGGLGAQRILLTFSPLAIALFSAFAYEHTNTVMKFAIVAVLVVQVFSVGFVPDYPNSYRQYLTEEEVEAKEFGSNHFQDTIHTDLFYATESTLPVSKRGRQIDKDYNPYIDNQFENIGPDLLDKNITKHRYQTVAIRTDISVVRTTIPSPWVLTWSPEQTLDQDTGYVKVYDSGSVKYYT